MKQALLIVTIGVAAVASYFALSWPRPTGIHLNPTCTCAKSPSLARHLNLTGEQGARIRELDESFNARREKVCRLLCDKRIELGKLLLKEDGKPEDAYAVIDEINAIQGELERQIASHIFEVKTVLTAEQQSKFLSMIAKELCRPEEGVK